MGSYLMIKKSFFFFAKPHTNKNCATKNDANILHNTGNKKLPCITVLGSYVHMAPLSNNHNHTQKRIRSKIKQPKAMDTAAVAAIESNCIAENTKSRYNSSNYQFIIWLYENQDDFPNILRERLIREIREVEENEILGPKKKKRVVRSIIIGNWLEKMERTNPQACPADTSLITYDLVSSYMCQKKGNNGGYLSKNCYCGIRSGIIHLFTMTNTSPPRRFLE